MGIGGNVWFGIESKSFEISVESLKGKISGVITERGWSFLLWIRFGDGGLSLFLEGVEFCCQKENLKVFSKSWLEGGRSYRLQLRINEVGRFLLCSIFSVEGKRFVLIFPKGKGLPGGWAVFAQKLRSCGVVLPHEVAEVLLAGDTSMQRKAAMGLKDLLPLAGSDGCASEGQVISFGCNLGVLTLLTMHPSTGAGEVERVLLEGVRVFNGKVLMLDRWSPETGLLKEGVQARSAWVRLVGLLLFLGTKRSLNRWVMPVGVASSKDWLEAREKMMGAPCVPRRVESLALKLRSKRGEMASGDRLEAVDGTDSTVFSAEKLQFVAQETDGVEAEENKSLSAVGQL
ncbi:hypothetical protein CK203_053789 [Vitis vinifera]|uniref:Uncharacterized protein n=1 Tax=Vitis vinifera TaxID=29760 RepID=A0A438GQP5_VITVI|nr:hypothetical protein CK203_053789 [Vitis vinifera]